MNRFLFLVATVLNTAFLMADNWPQLLGPDRTGQVTDKKWCIP